MIQCPLCKNNHIRFEPNPAGGWLAKCTPGNRPGPPCQINPASELHRALENMHVCNLEFRDRISDLERDYAISKQLHYTVHRDDMKDLYLHVTTAAATYEENGNATQTQGQGTESQHDPENTP